MKSKRKIRNYLINGVQLELSLKYLAVAVLSCVLTGFFVYVSLWRVIADYVPQAVMERLETEVRLRFLGFGFLLAIFVLCAYIVLSHQVVGPLQKIMNQIELIAKGDKDGIIKIRESDVILKPFAEKLNEYLQTIRAKK